MRSPDKALKYGIKNLTSCFEGVSHNVCKTIHACCGYPTYLVSIQFSCLNLFCDNFKICIVCFENKAVKFYSTEAACQRKLAGIPFRRAEPSGFRYFIWVNLVIPCE